MSKVQTLRESVKRRLTAAAQEIFELFERTLAEYEKELCQTKEENQRQQKLLDAVFNPEVRLNRLDVQQPSVSEADFPSEQQERSLSVAASFSLFNIQQLLETQEAVPPEQPECSSSLDQEAPDRPHIKEEQDQLWTSQEGEQLQGLVEADITSIPVPHDDDDDVDDDVDKTQSSQLHQRQTEQTKTEADGDDRGASEAARNSHPDTLIPPVNSVKSLQATPFEKRTLREKLSVKELGPDQPDVTIKQQTKDRGREYTRSFSRTWFDKKAWLTACSEANALFCFPCLLFPSTGSDPTWIQTGMTDLKNFSEKSKKHEQTRVHMENTVKLAMFGRVSLSADGDDCGESEAARDSHPDRLLLQVNSVKSLKATPFERRTLQEKLSVTELGPDQPDITIKQQTKDRGREYTRSFSSTWFDKKAWLTACSETNALFCFPCLLFPTTGSDPTWIQTGMTDLKYLVEKSKRHEKSRIHMENAERLAMFRKVKLSDDCGDSEAARSSRSDRLLSPDTDETSDSWEPDTTGRTTFSCSECGKQFRSRTCLKRHMMMIHTGWKPCRCSVCGKSLTKSGMRYHMKIHTGEKPFCCSLCGKRFPWKSILKTHMRTHLEQSMFSCSECGKRFNRKGNLLDHIRIHSTQTV